jgi:anti-sigma-K factor RskA
MTDHHDPDRADRELDVVETLLRELTTEDSDRVDPPEDLWDLIESKIDRPQSDAPVVALDRHRRFSPRMAIVFAAAAALVVIVGTIAVLAQRDDEPLVVATAELEYDPVSFDELGADAAAHVSLLDENGMFLIDVDDSDLPRPSNQSADLELWLIQPDAEGNPADLVSLGLVDPDEPGDFGVPATYDPDVYFVVDISVEPRDGDATHSGRSILRGALTKA